MRSFLNKDGKRVAVGPLPPKGQACNRKAGCVVYENVNWPDDRRNILQLEIVNRPENWSGSTFLAVYVMPPGLKVSHTSAADLIANHPEWPRQNAIGFTELGYRGAVNLEDKPTRIEVKLVGSPKELAPLPE